MKKATAIIVFIIISLGSIAQTNTFPFPSSGNVGIGTTTPKTILDVYSNNDIWHLMVGGGTSKLLVGGNASAGIVLQGGAASTANNTAVTTPYNIILQRDGGNVGIGTTAPGYKLDVSGVINAGGDQPLAGTGLAMGSYVSGGYKWL